MVLGGRWRVLLVGALGLLTVKSNQRLKSFDFHSVVGKGSWFTRFFKRVPFHQQLVNTLFLFQLKRS